MALAGLTAVGSTGIYLTSDDAGAQAEASSGDLTVPDVSTASEGDSIEDVTLSVDASWSYESSHIPDEWRLSLLIGDQESTLASIDTVEETDVTLTSDEGTATLSGSVLSTWHYSYADFEAGEGSEVSQSVWVGLRFEVLKDMDTIAEAQVVEPVQVSVDGAALEASASVGGEGNISVSVGE